jgi:hypothetical protein
MKHNIKSDISSEEEEI